MAGSIAGAALHGLDLCIQRAHVQALHKGPDATGRMVMGQQRLQVKGAQLNLIALGLEQARRAGGCCGYGDLVSARQRRGRLEQYRLMLCKTGFAGY